MIIIIIIIIIIIYLANLRVSENCPEVSEKSGNLSGSGEWQPWGGVVPGFSHPTHENWNFLGPLFNWKSKGAGKIFRPPP